MQKKKLIYNITCILLSGITLCGMYIFPEITRKAVADGLALCVKTIIPTLLPYIIISKIFATYVTRLNLRKKKNRVNSNVICMIVVLLGLMSGFPCGAILTCSFFEGNTISKERAESLVAASNSISPIFCISVFGERILNKSLYGFITFLSLVTVNTIILFFMIKFENDKSVSTVPNSEFQKENEIIEQGLGNIISEGMLSILNICAFVTFFMCVSRILTVYFELFGLTSPKLLSLCHSIIEVTCGLETIKNLDYGERFLMGNAAMGFGGLSAVMQVCSVCEKNGLSPKRFILSRILSFFAVPIISILLLTLVPENLISPY